MLVDPLAEGHWGAWSFCSRDLATYNSGESLIWMLPGLTGVVNLCRACVGQARSAGLMLHGPGRHNAPVPGPRCRPPTTTEQAVCDGGTTGNRISGAASAPASYHAEPVLPRWFLRSRSSLKGCLSVEEALEPDDRLSAKELQLMGYFMEHPRDNHPDHAGAQALVADEVSDHNVVGCPGAAAAR